MVGLWVFEKGDKSIVRLVELMLGQAGLSKDGLVEMAKPANAETKMPIDLVWQIAIGFAHPTTHLNRPFCAAKARNQVGVKLVPRSPLGEKRVASIKEDGLKGDGGQGFLGGEGGL
jgi:hypothetical protein